MKISLIAFLLGLAAAEAVSAQVADVVDASELVQALRKGKTSIVIRRHLDLSATESDRDLPLELLPSTRSIQVRSLPAFVQSRCQCR